MKKKRRKRKKPRLLPPGPDPDISFGVWVFFASLKLFQTAKPSP
jgi:hypothetical protein